MNPETWPLFLLTPKVFREVLEGELVQDCGPPGSPRPPGSACLLHGRQCSWHRSCLRLPLGHTWKPRLEAFRPP